MINFSTFGESHGKAVGVVVEGLPAGLKVEIEKINGELSRRQSGYGRGGRMRIEKDEAEIISGVRWGETIGAPVCILIKNNDWENNKLKLSSDAKFRDKNLYITKPRPGHADLSGLLKYARADITDILERSSARETAARVAAGALFKILLSEIDIKIYSWVIALGGIEVKNNPSDPGKLFSLAEKSPLRVPEKNAEEKMLKKIDGAKKSGDTVGGVFRVIAAGVPVGLGSYVTWGDRLDGQIAQAMMSIPAIKGVEIGLGFEVGKLYGSEVHDEIFYGSPRIHSGLPDGEAGVSQSLSLGTYGSANRYFRKTNNAGGIEGGISNGENIVVNCAMKPIPTLMKPLKSVDIKTKKQVAAESIRSDVCAVPAAAVVGEAMMAYVIAKNAKDKFGGDTMRELKSNLTNYKKTAYLQMLL